MSSRFRFLLNRLGRIKASYKSVPIVAFQRFPKRSVVTSSTLGFSLFTWLGFDKKHNAEDELILTIKHCVLFIQKGDYEKAEQLLHVALRQAQQIGHKLGVTYIYDVMANLALEREQLDKAKNLFIAVAQRIMADGATEDDPRVIHISVKLARISHLKKEYNTGQMGYDWCLDKLQDVIKKDPSEDNMKLLAITEDWYGRLFLDCNMYEQGVKLMISALTNMKKVPSAEYEHISVQLNDIGTTYDSMGKTDESISYLTEAIELGKQVPNNEYLGVMYVNLGKVYIKKNLLGEARKYCGQGWKISTISKNSEAKKAAELCFQEINKIS